MTSEPPLIAVVGCDGSGKSTLTQALQAWLEQRRPTVTCHLGKQSGNVGRTLARMPLLGTRIDNSIHTRSQAAQGSKSPGLLAAMVIYAFTLRRARRFRRMIRLRRAGNAIIADRFPQLEVPGSDGLGLSATTARGLVGLLATAERRLFATMTVQAPDLVLRLNVSLNVAAARKPDHRLAALARKVADLPRLRFGGAPIVDLDADMPFDQVLARAQAAIEALLARIEGDTNPSSVAA
jgi:thymidylate kinase